MMFAFLIMTVLGQNHVVIPTQIGIYPNFKECEIARQAVMLHNAMAEPYVKFEGSLMFECLPNGVKND